MGNHVTRRTRRSPGEILQENPIPFSAVVLSALGAVLVNLGRPSDAAMAAGVALVGAMVAVTQEAHVTTMASRRPSTHAWWDRVLL